MAMRNIPDFLNAISNALRQSDGQAMGALHSRKNVAAMVSFVPRAEAQLDFLCSNKLQYPFDEVAAGVVRASVAVQQSKFLDAYASHLHALTVFNKAFKEVESNTLLPLLHALVLDLRILSIRADGELTKKGKKPDKVDDAGRVMMQCFSVCNNDRAPMEQNKKWGTINIINQLLRLYFQNNQLHMCKPLVRSVDMMQSVVPFEHLPIGSQVTFNYFCGRLALLDDDYVKAEQLLEFCLKRCNTAASNNRRRILINLIPVKLLRGRSPSLALLTKYNLSNEFSAIVQAVQQASLEMLTTALEEHEDFFIDNSVYLVLEKLKNVIYRNIFKRVAAAVAPETKLNLDWFQRALQMQGSELELDEIECVLANLIHGGWIKGYISHQHRKLVVSKGIAFPSLHK